MPKRIQRKRTKGWRMPEGAVYVGRPTKWGNPFIIGKHGKTHEDVTDLFELFTLQTPGYCDEVRRELRGRDLACWCREGKHCHADVLLEIANADDEVQA